MRKNPKFLILTLTLVAAFTAQAQFRIGLRGGILSSSADFSETTAGQTIENRIGVMGSLVTEIRFNKGFAIQPEASWVQRGWKNSNVVSLPFFGTTETIYEEKINYLEIPIMMKGGVKLGPIRLDLLAGPSFAWAINGERKATIKITAPNGSTSEDSATEDIDFEMEVENADFGLQAGAAITVQAGPIGIFADGRYLYGLKDLSKNEDIEVKSRGVALSAGVLFGF